MNIEDAAQVFLILLGAGLLIRFSFLLNDTHETVKRIEKKLRGEL